MLKDVFVRGDRYSLVAALTIDGYIAAEAIPGSFDSIDFLEFIQEQVVHSTYILNISDLTSLVVTLILPDSANEALP